MWPQPGALGSVADCRDCDATDGWRVDADNFPSGPHMEAFRVDLSCSGKPVGVPNVQGMSWAKRSCRRMLWHIVLKVREQNG